MNAENDKKLTDEELNKANGGFPRSDKYTTDEYAEAGVSFEPYIWIKNSYAFRGISISQKSAEKLADFYFANGRQCTDSEFSIINNQ